MGVWKIISLLEQELHIMMTPFIANLGGARLKTNDETLNFDLFYIYESRNVNDMNLQIYKLKIDVVLQF